MGTLPIFPSLDLTGGSPRRLWKNGKCPYFSHPAAAAKNRDVIDNQHGHRHQARLFGEHGDQQSQRGRREPADAALQSVSAEEE